MARKALKVESLEVSSFATAASLMDPVDDPRCCTGCDSGCGRNPTALGCESGGDGGGVAIAY